MVLGKHPLGHPFELCMDLPTKMYDTTNFINDTSDREPIRSELSDKFTNALKASCAAACNHVEQVSAQVRETPYKLVSTEYLYVSYDIIFLFLLQATPS